MSNIAERVVARVAGEETRTAATPTDPSHFIYEVVRVSKAFEASVVRFAEEAKKIQAELEDLKKGKPTASEDDAAELRNAVIIMLAAVRAATAHLAPSARENHGAMDTVEDIALRYR